MTSINLKFMKTDVSTFDIAIIGAGFAGSMLTVHLLNLAQGPLRIALIDKSSILSRGVAYGTQDPAHLLNIPVVQMGAFPQQPDHFYKWLQEHQHAWMHLDPTFADLDITPGAYVPRHLYGFYLSNVLSEACRENAEKEITIELLHDEVVDVQNTLCATLELTLSSGAKLEAHKMVLATGVPAVQPIPTKGLTNLPGPTFKRDHPLEASSLSALPKESSLTVIGAGLTMLDEVMSLIDRGYPGKITAFSPQGWLPEVHRTHSQFHEESDPLEKTPKTALELFKKLHRAAKECTRKGDDWRSLIDHYRTHSSKIWEALSNSEKSKVFKHLRALWNRFRHRMPGIMQLALEELIEEGRFELIAGRVTSVEGLGNRVAIRYLPKGEKETATFMTDYVLNCTGPNYAIDTVQWPLMQNLLKRGILQPHPTGYGIAVAMDGSAKGVLEGKLFALGQLLIGERFESITVPEIREQALHLSEKLLSDIFSVKSSV